MDAQKSNAELLEEITRLRAQVAALEADAARHQQTEQTRRGDEQDYRIIADTAYDWEYWCNPDGTLRYVSPACERITGYTPAQFFADSGLLREIVLPEDHAVWDAHRQHDAGESGPLEVQFRIRRANGEVRWLEHVCQPVRDESGAFLGWRVSNRDITDRKQDELQRHKNRQVLETLMRNLPGMVYRCLNDHRWTMKFLSEGCTVLTGYDPPDLLDNRVIAYGDLIHPDDRKHVWQTVQEGVRAGDPYEVVYRLQTRYGKEKWVWEQGRQITLSDGSVLLEGLITDITIRIRVEEALRRSEARSRALLDAVPDLMFQVDREGIFLRYHDGGMGTCTPAMEFLGRSMFDVFPASLATRTKYAIDRALASRDIQILQYKLPAGDELRDYEARIVASGDDEVAMIVREITTRVRAERALRASEERLRTLINATPDIICFKDGDGRWLLANQAMLDLFGLTEASYRGKTDQELIAFSPTQHDILTISYSADQHAWAQGTLSRGDEVIPNPDGEERAFDIIKVPLFYPDGKRKALVVLGRDITERKTAEELLYRREEGFRTLVENNPNLVARVDRELRLQYVNPAMTRMTGVPYEDTVGKTSAELGFPDELVTLWNTAYERVFQTGKGVAFEFTYEVPRDGLRYFESHIMPEFPERGPVQTLLMISRDITEKKEAAEQRVTLAIERERVAILAHFLQNLSHEFRTPLSIVYTGLDALQRSAQLDERNVQRVARIQEQASYVGRLVDAMMTMAQLDGDPRYVFGSHDLSMILSDIQHEIETLAKPKNLAVTLELPDDLPFVHCDPSELRRAVFNICENAVDYTPEGGAITIRVSLDSSQVQIEVADTGIGIGDDDFPHIFERFYRADKARTGRHAGLGLAISKTIIDAHQGTIEVQSTLGEGSTFRVILPLTADQ